MSQTITRERLDQIKEKRFVEIALRHAQEPEKIEFTQGLVEDGKIHVMVCGGTGCHASQSDEIRQRLDEQVAAYNLQDKVEIHRTGCFGLCEVGPNIVVYPQGIFYCHVTLADVDEIVKHHFVDGRILERLIFHESHMDDDHMTPVEQVGFYKHQVRIALANCGRVDPENIEDYIAFDGYQALANAVLEQTPEEIVQIISDSGLRGRGGAGFPTGKKWEFTKNASGKKKYVVCNADEGDPGAFMDRSILEGDPHTLIEAMTIAAYAVGADEGFVYVRAEYPIAVERLKIAIKEAEEFGFLGDHIFGTDFCFKLHIRLGAGAFVCGEETALIESIEGKRGTPRNKPPFPATSGVYNKPTLINNVETYANICPILRKGADWFRSIGTETSPGTKVFSLGGNIYNTGLIEVPMGMTFREIIYDIGGGIPGGKEFKAVQTGGPSGGCIPAEYLDTPVDYESLKALGSMMGSGGMIVMDETSCMVDIAKFYLEFTVEESCGKCTPCRIGNKRLLEVLDKMTKGEATQKDLDRLLPLAEMIKSTSACGLGQSSPNPVISTYQYFKDEYEAHVLEKRCPTHKCKPLIEFYITEDCIGCTKCARNCPVKCIDGEMRSMHVIRTEECIKCGNCVTVCPKHAVLVR